MKLYLAVAEAVQHVDVDGLSFIEKNLLGEARWSLRYEVIVKDSNGYFWRFEIEEPATEESGYIEDYNPNKIELDRVEPYTEVVIKYRKV